MWLIVGNRPPHACSHRGFEPRGDLAQFGPDGVTAAFSNIANALVFVGLSAIDDCRSLCPTIGVCLRDCRKTFHESGRSSAFKANNVTDLRIVELLDMNQLIAKSVHKVSGILSEFFETAFELANGLSRSALVRSTLALRQDDQRLAPPLCRPYCGVRFRGLPIATKKMALLPFACGEKNLITSLSKKVSPVPPRRWAYAAR